MLRVIIFSMVVLVGFSSSAQRSAVRREIQRDQELKQEQKYSEERKKGEKAVDERLDRMDQLDAEYRAGVKPFPTMSYKVTIEYPDKPKNNTEMHYYFKQFDCVMLMPQKEGKSEEMRVITNFKSGKATTLTTDKKGRKTGMVMDLKMMTSMDRGVANKENQMLEDGRSEIRMTDEYKTINGYKCRKYIYDHPKYTAEMWVTQDKLPVNASDFTFGMANAMSGSQQSINTSYYSKIKGGVCIQTHLIPKDRHMQESIMTYSEFSAQAPDQMFSTAGYELQEMPSLRDVWNNYKEEK